MSEGKLRKVQHALAPDHVVVVTRCRDFGVPLWALLDVSLTFYNVSCPLCAWPIVTKSVFLVFVLEKVVRFLRRTSPQKTGVEGFVCLLESDDPAWFFLQQLANAEAGSGFCMSPLSLLESAAGIMLQLEGLYVCGLPLGNFARIKCNCKMARIVLLADREAAPTEISRLIPATGVPATCFPRAAGEMPQSDPDHAMWELLAQGCSRNCFTPCEGAVMRFARIVSDSKVQEVQRSEDVCMGCSK